MFSEKSILITGASTGIGKEVAEYFAARGAKRFILADRDGRGLEYLSKDFQSKGSKVLTCQVDIGNRHEVDEVLKPACKIFGTIDILVNNAGVADENEPDDEKTWDKVLQVNLHGTYYVTVAVLPYLPEEGRIINVSSILGKAGKLRNTAYCTSKHGVLGFTKALAMDLASRRITVNAVLPGWVDTPMLRVELERQANLLGTDTERLLQNARKGIPLRRLVMPSEAASMIGFLASQEASAITAQSFTVDAGFSRGV